MVIASSGQISFQDLQTEFGGDNPISLSEYYSDATTGYTDGVSEIPNEGLPISLSIFHGKAVRHVKLVECGRDYTHFILKGGGVKACGKNDTGQLGIGNNASTTNIVAVVNLGLPVIQISSGYNQTLFLLNNFQVKACGENYSGELGLGYTGSVHNKNTPTSVVNLSEGVKQVSAGYNYSAFLLNNGQVKACGDNSHGQWGATTPGNGGTPTLVPNVSGIAQIATGWGHTMYVNNSGELFSNGLNGDGQIARSGNNKAVETTTITNVKKVACGLQHTIILKNDGTTEAYGMNLHGSATGLQSPYIYNASEVQDIFAGDYKSYVLLNNGKVIRFGKDDWSGSWSTEHSDYPIDISSTDKIVGMASGNFYEIYILDNGNLIGRGTNGAGQLGPPVGNSAGFRNITP